MYSAWLQAYKKIHPDVQISYQAIGSGGGIRQIMENAVDFGATDDPMSEKQLRDYRDTHGSDMLHLPTLMGAAVPAYNVPGLGDVNFTPEILAGIYLGRITKWDDSALREANPGVSLPSNNIMVVHRAEGSGTSYVWSDYLSKVSDAWRARVGRGTSLNWPVGLSARGNDGVADLLHKTSYSLGYVELGFALQKRLTYGKVRNAAGAFVKADPTSVAAAATEATTNVPEDFRISITNAPGKGAYPISSLSWLLVPAKIADPNKRKALVDFLTWALTDGQNMGSGLVYARLPQNVVSKELTALSRIQ
jgi:phosphate transport system substrate-binding protein